MLETLRRQEDRRPIGREQAAIDSQIAYLRRINRGGAPYPSLGGEIKSLSRQTRLIQRDVNRKRHGNRTGQKSISLAP